MTVNIMPISDLRRKTNDAIRIARDQDEPVYITHYGRPAAVLLSYERYEALLERLEDLSDQASLQAAIEEPTRPYAEFLSELEAKDAS